MAIYDKDGVSLETAYDINGSNLQHAYDIEGNEVLFRSPVIDYSDYYITDYCNVSIQNMQGFDIYNEIIFQFRGSSSLNNKMATINVQNASIIDDNITAYSDHGDSASFMSQFYSASDEYPMILVTADTNPAKVYQNRVTTESCSLVKTYSFPLDKTGYYAAHIYDEENQILYMVGYSEQNYRTDDGGNNKTVISKWDMSDLTESSGVYTPAFISSYERAFILCMQGQQYHDGMLWIASGYGGARSYVYALDPTDGTLLYIVDTGTNTEIEGLAFISDSVMVYGLQGGTYKKVTFATS